jgi:hypothetical protein
MRRTQFRYPVSTLAGSSLRNILEMQRSYIIEPKYRRKFLLTKGVAGIFEFFNLIEQIAWQKRINNYKPEVPPVFIIGFWRSGTTLLHNLLCRDPESAYTTTFQTVFPNLFLTQSWWLKPLTNYMLPAQRPYDNVSMDMDYPQEEDFGMMNIQSSTVYKFFLFPADFDRIVNEELFTQNLSPDKLNRWKEAYVNMMAKAVFNTGGKRYIGKNPCHIPRMGLLREMFPDAKFIFIHRNPYLVIESLYRFVLSIFPGVQLQDVPKNFSRENIAWFYKKVMQAYLKDRKLIPPGNLIELCMDDFLKDIHGNMKKIYSSFGLGDFGRVSGAMQNYLDENPRPEHIAEPPTQETIDLADSFAGDIIRELGYTGTFAKT